MTRAARFLAWAAGIFGDSARHPAERAARFAEEAIELVHAQGLPRDRLLLILDRVYAGPRGDVAKEIGQATASLEMPALVLGHSSDQQAELELHRVQQFPPDHWIRRHQAKIALGIADAIPPAAEAPAGMT